MMHLAGFFPSVPSQVNFELTFAPVESQWRLFGISGSIGQSAPVAGGAFCTGREGTAHRREKNRDAAGEAAEAVGSPLHSHEVM